MLRGMPWKPLCRRAGVIQGFTVVINTSGGVLRKPPVVFTFIPGRLCFFMLLCLPFTYLLLHNADIATVDGGKMHCIPLF